MKKNLVFIFLLLGLVIGVGNVFAHDAGDLMLNIEPQIGYLIPDIGIWIGGVEVSNNPYYDASKLGLNVGLSGTVHYYFFDFIGINAGIGFTFNYLEYTLKPKNTLSSYGDPSFSFGEFYVNIPFGLRFSLSAFALGAGLSYNIPVASNAQQNVPSDNYKEVDKDFKLDSYLGWYADLGFDLSGIKGRNGGFGMMIRLSGPISSQIGNTNNYQMFSGNKLEYKPFSHLAISLVFQGAVELGNFPIGRRRGGDEE